MTYNICVFFNWNLIVDVGFILWVKAMVGSTLDLLSLFNILPSKCLAHLAQISFSTKK